MGSCASSHSINKDAILQRGPRINTSKLSGRYVKSDCAHQEVVRQMHEYALSKSQLEICSPKCDEGRWTVCRHCKVLFLIKSDGFYASAPVLEDPSTTSSLAARRNLSTERPNRLLVK